MMSWCYYEDVWGAWRTQYVYMYMVLRMCKLHRMYKLTSCAVGEEAEKAIIQSISRSYNREYVIHTHCCRTYY